MAPSGGPSLGRTQRHRESLADCALCARHQWVHEVRLEGPLSVFVCERAPRSGPPCQEDDHRFGRWGDCRRPGQAYSDKFGAAGLACPATDRVPGVPARASTGRR